MNLPDDIKDKFWTLTVYFNSLKDLGKCSTLVDDDVKDFIKRTAFRLGSAKDARMIARADELTSRVNTTQLNETLDKLEKHCYSKENIENKRYPSNVLLATNKFNRKDYAARIAELKKYITERASDISKRMNTEMVDDSSEIAFEIDSVFEKWEQLAENFDEEHFYYGEKFLIKEPDDGEGRLMKYLFTTCRKFKGLEADVVILLDVDKTTFEQGNALIFYVGTSRARIKLEIAAILSDDDCKEILMSILNYRGKIRRAQKDLAGALNAIGSLDS